MSAEGIVYRQVNLLWNQSRLVKINRPRYFESLPIGVPFVSPALGKFPAELVEVLETTLLCLRSIPFIFEEGWRDRAELETSPRGAAALESKFLPFSKDSILHFMKSGVRASACG